MLQGQGATGGVLRPYATHCITWLLSQKEASCEDNAKQIPQFAADKQTKDMG